MKPFEYYLDLAKNYYDTREERKNKFGQFPCFNDDEEDEFNELYDKEADIEFTFDNDLHLDIYKIDHDIQYKIVLLFNKYYAKNQIYYNHC